MNARRALPMLVVVAFAAAAVANRSTGASPSPVIADASVEDVDPGACTPDGEQQLANGMYEASELPMNIERLPTWLEVEDTLEIVAVGEQYGPEEDWDPDGPPVVLGTADAHVLRGVRAVEVETIDARAQRVIQQVNAGATLILGVNAFDRLTVAAAEESDGDIRFIGNCLHLLTQSFAAFAENYPDRTPGQLLRELIAAPGGDASRALSEAYYGPPNTPVSWEDLDEWVRLIDPETAPAEVFSRFRTVELTLVIPQSWRELKEGICTRTEMGWNSYCAGFAIHSEIDVIHIDAFVLPGAPLDIWLMAEEQVPPVPLVLMGTLPAELVALATGLTIEFDPDVTSLDDLMGRLDRGEPVFTVT